MTVRPYPVFASMVVVPSAKAIESRQQCDERTVGAADAAEARANPTARSGDLHVGTPRDALLELPLSGPEEHGVRVRSHEPRDHQPARGVEDLGRREAGAELRLRTHSEDPLTITGHGLTLRMMNAREAGGAEGLAAPRSGELTDPDDEEGAGRRRAGSLRAGRHGRRPA